MWFFAPVCGKMKAEVWSYSLKRPGSSKTTAKSRCRIMNVHVLAPRDTSLLCKDQPSPLKAILPHSSKEKKDPTRASVHLPPSWAPFSADEFLCGKTFAFSKPKCKDQNPRQAISLEIFVDELSQRSEALSRHNPCSEGVSPPPLL